MKKEFKKETSISLHKGHKVWEVNNETLEILEVQFSKIDLKTDEENSANRKIIMKKDFTYICALNKRNVRKKLLKMVIEEKNNNK